MVEHSPGKLLCLVALASGLTDLGFGLYGLIESLGGGMFAELGALLAAAAIGLAVLAVVAIRLSAAGRHVVAWLAVAAPAIAAYELLSGV